ncbi:ribosome-associated GTPase [Babesia caballi]|uniref:Ribosome-associated GTPase n=1 Tax=Babesia caballi TaxID=5871 RepID=A0AAV4LYN1_BABCB|nr:ribosome-associated GTPase [Babesia caballi]
MTAIYDIIERLVGDCECVTVAAVAESLGTDYGSASQAVLDFAKNRGTLELIYSVCYVDESNSIVLSHSTEAEVERLRSKYGDVKATLFGVRAGESDGGAAVPQICWKQELELVENQLKLASEKERLYIPSYAKLGPGEIRLRKYELSKQGDSALCTPSYKPTAAATNGSVTSSVAATGARSEAKKGQKKPPTAFSFDSFKNTGANKRPKLEAPSPAVEQSSAPSCGNLDAAALPVHVSRQPSAVPDTAASSYPATVITSTDFKSFVSQQKAQPSANDTAATSAKIDTSFVSQSEGETTSSLFACDDPCDAMALDVPSCNDLPVSYVEKVRCHHSSDVELSQVTKENTYVDSGYFVVEERDEYVQVTAPAKGPPGGVSRLGGNAKSADNGRTGMMKKPQKSMNQITLKCVRVSVP